MYNNNRLFKIIIWIMLITMLLSTVLLSIQFVMA
ncbi:stressosome-associated protein Prli42 [Paenibacillus thermotolerans]|nr:MULTISPECIES: stressosome-associated protein Prli42 [unclassified Paenibacillus]